MSQEADTAAVITDVHGNLPALEASLREAEGLGVDAVYCGGDLVGYGPHPNEVCALVEERAIPTIYGNYDYAIARDLEDCGCAYVTPEDRALGRRSVTWTLEHTNRRAKDFMRDLPFDLRFRVGSKRVRLAESLPAPGHPTFRGPDGEANGFCSNPVGCAAKFPGRYAGGFCLWDGRADRRAY